MKNKTTKTTPCGKYNGVQFNKYTNTGVLLNHNCYNCGRVMGITFPSDLDGFCSDECRAENSQPVKLTIDELLKLDKENYKEYKKVVLGYFNPAHRLANNYYSRCVFAYKVYDKFAIVFSIQINKNKIHSYTIISSHLLGSFTVLPLSIDHVHNIYNITEDGKTRILDTDDWNLLKSQIFLNKLEKD